MKIIYVYNSFTHLFNVIIQRTTPKFFRISRMVLSLDSDKGTAKNQGNETKA